MKKELARLAADWSWRGFLFHLRRLGCVFNWVKWILRHIFMPECVLICRAVVFPLLQPSAYVLEVFKKVKSRWVPRALLLNRFVTKYWISGLGLAGVLGGLLCWVWAKLESLGLLSLAASFRARMELGKLFLSWGVLDEACVYELAAWRCTYMWKAAWGCWVSKTVCLLPVPEDVCWQGL